MHTKGVSRAANESHIFRWVFYMHYFILKHYTLCLALLRHQFDLCGVDIRQQPAEHYSGNFWWARASYYLSLPDTISADYLGPEMYICSRKPRRRCLWDSQTNLYLVDFQPATFVDTAPSALELPHQKAL